MPFLGKDGAKTKTARTHQGGAIDKLTYQKGGEGTVTQNQRLKASTREAEGPYLYLFHTGPLKPQIKAVICQAANLLTVPVIAHADNWNLGVLYERDKFLLIKKKKKNV